MADDPSIEEESTVADLTQVAYIRWSAIEDLNTVLSASWRQVTLDHALRFRLWSNNLETCHPVNDHRSADHRLRAAPDVKKRIAQLLEELCESLDDIRATTDTGALLRDDGITHSRSGISELWLMVEGVITSLFKVSVLVRQNSSRNRFDHAVRSASKANASSMPAIWDIEHVRCKFPKLEEKQWLIRRLGEMGAQRRTFLMYAKDHERRIGSDGNGVHGTTSVASRPTEASTHATILPPTKINSSMLQRLEDYDGDDAVSTASATTCDSNNDIDARKVVPLASVCVDRKPVICPYCRGMVHFKKEKAWR
jgi:hypothetical protein